MGYVAGGKKAQRIVVDKTARTLSLIERGAVAATFPVLVGENPGPKTREGDNKTPEGSYTVLRLLSDEGAVGAGHYKGLHLSYPSITDAERGLAECRIDRALYDQFMNEYQESRIPPQETVLGGYVAIHAGLAPDETFARGTKGCIVLRSADMDAVYSFAGPGMPVQIRA